MIPVILNEEPIRRSRISTVAGLPPSFAIVHQLGDGDWEVEGATPKSWTERLFNRDRWCYIVDLGDHRRQVALTKTPVTCSDQAHRFEVRLDVGLRVHDPVILVRRNVRDAASPVYAFLKSEVRRIAARFAIDESLHAQSEINQFFSGNVTLAEGITLFHCTVELEPDSDARDYIKSLKRAERDSVFHRRSRAGELAQTLHDEKLEDIRHSSRARREAEDREALEPLLRSVPQRSAE